MQSNQPHKRSHSSGYGAEIAKTICLRLVNRESLRSICADPLMPAKATACAGSLAIRNFAAGTPLARVFQVEVSYDPRAVAARVELKWEPPAPRSPRGRKKIL
jgi:hypothetical protein